MSPELAAQIISKIKDPHEKIEMFVHFKHFFWPIPDPDKQEMFAAMCGFGIARYVQYSGPIYRSDGFH